jgi:hypothetical protein
MPQRVCRSNPQSAAQSNAARSLMREIFFNFGRESGSLGVTANEAAIARQERSRGEIEGELRRLVGENSKIFRAAIKYIEAEDAYREARAERAASLNSK